MSFCKYCGKQIPDNIKLCDACQQQLTQENAQPVTVHVQTPEATPVAPVVSAVPVAVPYVDMDSDYLKITEGCKLNNILGIIFFVTGLIALVFISGWVAAIAFLVAELLVLVPNTKVQKLCKAKNPMADKKAQQKITKETIKRLKSRDKNFNFSFIIAIACLVCLILSFVVPSPLVGNNGGNIEASNDTESLVDNDTEENKQFFKNADATSYITKDNFELYETIKPYCKQIGYDVDSWTVHTNTETSLLLIGPDMTQGQQVMVNDNTMLVQMAKGYFVVGNGEGIITITGKNKEQIFGFVDALFRDCPDDNKYTGQYLMDNHESKVVNGTSKFEKDGVIYQVTHIPKTGSWTIVLKLA